MTLQEAKDQIAKEYGYTDWWSVDFTNVSEEAMRDEVAREYARSKWDEACSHYHKILIDHLNNDEIKFVAGKPEFKI